MDEKTRDLINDHPYTGKVLTFRRDTRLSEDAAVGRGTYGYLAKKKRTRILPKSSNGNDAA